jgi:hypothetical protein
MGAYAGGQVLISKEAAFPIVMPVAFLIGFYTGEGRFQTKVRITDPKGNLMVEDLPIGDVDKVPGQPMQIMVNFGIFEFPVEGRYRIDALLDDRIYAQYLTVSLSDQTFT